ncbi:MAG: SprT-like domain-containing protein [Fluviicola sp.]|nr:SprT-like domain-containing protein [Fluviicola sp.]
MQERTKYHAFFEKFISNDFLEYVVSVILENSVRFKIVKPRKTKLGDFRAGRKGEMHIITINNNLNPYSFLITTLHEFAHLIAHNKFGRRIQPHGKEWQSTYTDLIHPLIESKKLPEDIENALLNSLVKVKASSCSDVELQRALMKYDLRSEEITTLEQLDKNSIFALNNKTFQKGNLRRTRFLCKETNTKRDYLIHALAKVEEIKRK